MGKVEVKQVPRRLNPYGEKLMKIWYDDNMPPKNYIWYKDDEYCYWNGINWEPFEFGDIESNNKHNHHKHGCDCDCCESVKFEKFKKEILAAVLKLIKSQNPDSESALLNRIQTLERDVNTLKQINHNLFVKNTELESLLESLGYIKSEDIEGLDILTGLDEKLSRFDTRISTNNRNISDLNSRLASIESSVPSRLAALENAGYVTEQWVENNAIIPAANVSCNISGDIFDFDNVNRGLSDLVSKVEDMNNDISSFDSRISSIEESGGTSYDDSDLRSRIESLEEMSGSYATTEMIPTSVSQLDNDSGYISGIELTEEPNVTTVNNGEIISALTDMEMDDTGDGTYHLYGTISKFRINVATSETYDDSELRQIIEDNELVTSSSLNDLNSRVNTIESADYATETYVNNAIENLPSGGGSGDVTRNEMETYVNETVTNAMSDLAPIATSGSFNDLQDFPGNNDDYDYGFVTHQEYYDDLYGEDPVAKQSELSNYLTQEVADERYELKSE